MLFAVAGILLTVIHKFRGQLNALQSEMLLFTHTILLIEFPL